MMETERRRGFFRAKGTLGLCLAAGLSISLSAWGEQVELKNGVTLNYVVVDGGVHVGNTNAPYAAVSTDISGQLVLPETIEGMPVTEIGPEAFSGCANLTEVVLPASVTNICMLAFNGCELFTDIHLSEGLASIGDYAFQGCVSLGEIDFPSSLRRLGVGSFSGCNSLKSVFIPGGVSLDSRKTTRQMPVSTTTTAANGVTTTTVISGYDLVPDGLGAFQECAALESVTVAEGVDTIGAFAFRRCRNLETVSLPESLEAICPGAFSECPSLREIRLPEKLKTIGALTTQSENTTTESVAGGVTTTTWYSEGIKGSFGSEAGAFFRCTSLSRIEMPAAVEHIGDYTALLQS